MGGKTVQSYDPVLPQIYQTLVGSVPSFSHPENKYILYETAWFFSKFYKKKSLKNPTKQKSFVQKSSPHNFVNHIQNKTDSLLYVMQKIVYILFMYFLLSIQNIAVTGVSQHFIIAWMFAM